MAEQIINKAKLAEQAERYDDMAGVRSSGNVCMVGQVARLIAFC